MSGDIPPVLTASLSALRAGFDIAFPGRDHTTDGWIGDTAHQAEVSGHNPDDTPGVLAEYSDADTIPEVRAIDVDVDLRSPDFTMQDVINRILATPNDIMRLRYMIFNRTIWSKSNGWLPEPYTGSNPHTDHLHVSGDPLYDENDSPWSVATIGDDMPTVQEIAAYLWNDFNAGSKTNPVSPLKLLRQAATGVPADLIARLDAILAAASDDGQTIVVLPPEAIQDLQDIKAAIAAVPKAVVDEEVSRLAE